MHKPLPIGQQTLRNLIAGGYLYVDKTRTIYELIRDSGGIYFLSRPRRFGKSLLISTLEEIFLGNQALFAGLWLYDSDYLWQTYPVIRIDFSLRKVDSAEKMEQALSDHLQDVAQSYGVPLVGAGYQNQFINLIRHLAGDQQKVVILIDEYDYPIIDNLDNLAEATRIREVLKGFYSMIKALDRYLRFVFLTGVSKFSRVGVFSGLNNLKDISLDERFAGLLGITQAEVESYFDPYIQDFAAQQNIDKANLLAEIEFWYNGFRFSKGPQSVYNPFSLLLLLDMQDFRNYWFESGTPTFLIQLIQQRNYPLQTLQQLALSDLAFSTYELEKLEIVPLLFQTGYLTIKAYDKTARRYRLDFPNYEVEHAFLIWLLSAFSQLEYGFSENYLAQLVQALQTADLAAFFAILKLFFAQIPYDIQIKREQYYQSIFYVIFTLIGLRVKSEQRTRHGRIDAVVELPTDVYLFEFKLDGSAEAALQPIKDKGYAEPYQTQGKTIHLIGVNFDSQERTIAAWLEEKLPFTPY